MAENGTLGQFGQDGATAGVTYRFAPDGRPCAACDARVDRLWRDGDRLLCADCKPWS